MDLKYYGVYGYNDCVRELSCLFPSISHLEYMCLINSGNSFVLNYQEPYYFRRGFWRKYKNKNLIYEKLEAMEWPLGVSLRTKLLKPQEPGPVIRNKRYTICVSKEYSNAIYIKEYELFQNEDTFLGDILDYLDDYYLTKNKKIYINSTSIGVSFGKKYIFKDHGLMNLPSKFYEFVLARKLASYIECKDGRQLVGSITFWGSQIILEYDFNDKEHASKLTNWYD